MLEKRFQNYGKLGWKFFSIDLLNMIIWMFYHKVGKYIGMKKKVKAHENLVIRVWVAFARSFGQDGLIIDIGSYRGKFSVAAREVSPFASLVAFEPNKEMLSKLKPLAEIYRITLEEFALSNFSGKSQFIINKARSHITNKPKSDFANVSFVNTRRLDDYFIQPNIKNVLIKIDAEGEEINIITGAENLITKFRPIIICEVISNYQGLKLMSVIPDDYCFFYIGVGNEIVKRNNICNTKWYSFNWLLLPNEANIESYVQDIHLPI
jgi:FkbM family methyltransferase